MGNNAKDFQGFNCVKITSCGSYGNICGGFNTKAKSHDIKKTYKNLPAGTYTFSLDFIKIDSWDNEAAIVQVNGKTCWNKKLSAGSGSQKCGQKHGGWHEEKYKVTCSAPAVNGQFTVRVYTQLSSAANDESFGIDNVVLKQLSSGFKTITANFNNAKDFQGFNCVKITSCGSYGNICGGFNTKAKSHDIKKTYKNLPAGAGSQKCGQKHGGWHEERYKVTCTGESKNGQFTVRVYTNLSSGASDESFGIDNAVLTKV